MRNAMLSRLVRRLRPSKPCHYAARDGADEYTKEIVQAATWDVLAVVPARRGAKAIEMAIVVLLVGAAILIALAAYRRHMPSYIVPSLAVLAIAAVVADNVRKYYSAPVRLIRSHYKAAVEAGDILVTPQLDRRGRAALRHKLMKRAQDMGQDPRRGTAKDLPVV